MCFRCHPAYCKYKFGNLDWYKTAPKIQDKDIQWNDTNVVLLGKTVVVFWCLLSKRKNCLKVRDSSPLLKHKQNEFSSNFCPHGLDCFSVPGTVSAKSSGRLDILLYTTKMIRHLTLEWMIKSLLHFFRYNIHYVSTHQFQKLFNFVLHENHQCPKLFSQ